MGVPGLGSMMGGAAGAGAASGAGKAGLGSMLPGGEGGFMSKAISGLANGQLANTGTPAPSSGMGASGIRGPQDILSHYLNEIMGSGNKESY